MHPILRNILAVLLGAIIGMFVNMGIVMISGSVIAPPKGADVTTMEGLKASLHLFEPKHFIMPFLAHALGTFAGALMAGLIAANNRMAFSISIGGFFLLGGIANVLMLPGPMWFNIVDLTFAYIPMAFLAGRLAKR
jgi:hypothetical protein